MYSQGLTLQLALKLLALILLSLLITLFTHKSDAHEAKPDVHSDAIDLAKLQQPKKIGEFLGAIPTAYPDWFKDSFLEFTEDIEEATAEGTRLAILFHQDGCPYCNLLIERNLAQQDIQQLMKDKFDIVAINMWGARELVSVGGKTYTEREFSSALKVQYTPTILFFNESGKLALRLNGYLQPAEFNRALTYVAEKQETNMSYANYIAANRVEAANGELNQQAFFDKDTLDLTLPETGYEQPLAVFFEQTNCTQCDALHTSILKAPETLEIIDRFKGASKNLSFYT